jgi:hypothetical protein
MTAVSKPLRVRLSGDIEGDYVVLQRRAGGALHIAPAQPGGRLKVTALKQTSLACPSQWEGILGDGRAVYVRYRHGALSVGVGNDTGEAVRNSRSDHAFFVEYVGDGLDGFMDLEELKLHLHGLVEFPVELVVENER